MTGNILKTSVLILLMVLLSGGIKSRNIALIPQPENMNILEGEFTITKSTGLKFNSGDKDLQRIAGYLNDHLEKYYHLKLSSANQVSDVIQLQIIKSDDLGNEGYRMKIDKNGILISASAPNGIFYGIQTLKQLLPLNKSTQITVPFLEIKDKPRFSWRGLHLDVGRHFFPVYYIRQYIDNMAMYKLNVFHWHLTDDQGWRLEIRKFPMLTEKASWRDETFVGWDGDFFQKKLNEAKYDGIGVGGFYTQEQVRQIVKYAAERFITIVPEIEMPGHSCAALTAYPELGCTGGPYQVQKKWGVWDDVLCPGKEQTFKFLEGVLDEVCELFPSQYIHIGGDECSKVLWKKCPDCQKRIKDEKLKNEEELQSYLIRRIEEYLISRKRKLIGWEEILEGGLAPEATVMAWKSDTPAGSMAIREHHDVIRCPSEFCYFNHYNVKDPANEPLAYRGNVTLEKVYSFDPVPSSFTKEEARYIIGSQGCAWSEYIPNIRVLEYQVFPRVCATSEVCWTPKEKKDFKSFKERMVTEFQRLKLYGINYCDHPW
jgi:hexosaminidase